MGACRRRRKTCKLALRLAEGATRWRIHWHWGVYCTSSERYESSQGQSGRKKCYAYQRWGRSIRCTASGKTAVDVRTENLLPAELLVVTDSTGNNMNAPKRG